jgi:NitT/TauT family transport system substrate-binding protein
MTNSRCIEFSLLLLGASFLALCFDASGAQAAESPSRTKIRIATASPSLSYLPIYTAVKKGFFAKRGFDVEMIQMSASLTAPALLNRSIDYTTIPSTIATATARGAPAKVIFFASVKLQHMLLARADIATVNDLAGKRIAASGYGNLTSYEIQYVIDRYKLGPKTTIVSVISSTDRLLAMHKGIADAAIISAPLDLKGEELGLKRLIHMGTILQIPQAGLATTDEKLKTKRGEVLEVLKASIEGLEFTLAEREENSDIISKWMGLTVAQGVKAYDSVKDTFSRNGIPTDEQSRAYISMLAATAGVSPDLASATIFDFSFAAAAAKELAAKK